LDTPLYTDLVGYEVYILTPNSTLYGPNLR